jgi:hypothetical protein
VHFRKVVMVVRPSRIQDKDRPLKMQLSADRETFRDMEWSKLGRG